MTVQRPQRSVEDELPARCSAASRDPAALSAQVAELAQQLEREQARNQGLQLGIDQLSAELRRLREQTQGSDDDRS